MGAGGRVPLYFVLSDSEKIAKNLEKSGKIWGKEGKNREKREKIRKKRKNWEKAKIRKVLSLCPS